jgi:hypothetical protein
MTEISEVSTIAEVGAFVCDALKNAGIDAFLSGGAVVSIYTNNKYESFDLDFVSLADRTKIKRVMESLGFTQDKSRLFIHPRSKYYVEFPGAAMLVGESLISKYNELKLEGRVLRLLTPTDCVKDRLAAFYHWNDKQALDQAVWVAQAQPVDFEDVRQWSQVEGKLAEFDQFMTALKAAKA